MYICIVSNFFLLYFLCFDVCRQSELDGVHNIRAAIGGGLRIDIWNEVKERFKIPRIAEFYGATEAYSALNSFTEKPGAVGRLSPLLVGRKQNIC